MSLVFDIQRFCVNDGPGIRSTVFFKGCPLTCPWCHNPESNSFARQIAYQDERCVRCHACEQVCPTGAHIFDENGIHRIDFSVCKACGTCVDVCAHKALKIYGKEMSTDEILAVLRRDADYYSDSGGGVTISGGEPLCAYVKVLDLAARVKKEGWNLCLETSGYGTPRQFRALCGYVDTFLFDYKITGEGAYRAVIGIDEETVLNNLRAIDAAGGNVVLRCPIIPGYNDTDEHFVRIGELAHLRSVDHVEVLPYHNFGRGKAKQIGSTRYLEDEEVPTAERTAAWIERIERGCPKPVVKA